MRHEFNEGEYKTVLGAIFSDLLDMMENNSMQQIKG
jgi:hypothetical protein